MPSIIDQWLDNGVFRGKTHEEQLWRDAASEFRLPYWDWAKRQEDTGKCALPHIFAMEEVEILTPSGGRELFTNPLVRFVNPSGKPMGDVSMKENAIPDDTDETIDNQALPVSHDTKPSFYLLLPLECSSDQDRSGASVLAPVGTES